MVVPLSFMKLHDKTKLYNNETYYGTKFYFYYCSGLTIYTHKYKCYTYYFSLCAPLTKTYCYFLLHNSCTFLWNLKTRIK